MLDRLKRQLTAGQLSVSLLLLVLTGTSFWLDVQPFRGDRFIGHADQAEVASVARNLASGKGAVTDCVWLLHAGGRPGNEIQRPIGYWSLYVAGGLAPFFNVFGANRQTLLAVASITRILIALGAAGLVFRFARSRCASVACFIFLLFAPQMTSRISGYSDIYLSAAVLACVAVLVWTVPRASRIGWFTAGVIAGVAVGIKPSGLILLVMGFCFLFLPTNPRLNLKRRMILGGILLAGFLLGIMPLVTHNLQEGSVLWPDAKLVASAGTAREFLNIDHDTAFFDPTTTIYAEPAASTWKKRIRSLLRFSDAFIHENDIAALWFLPFVFVAFSQAVASWFRAKTVTCEAENVFVASGILLTAACFCIGLGVNVEPRYWNFIFPVFAVIAVTTAFRISRSYMHFIFVLSAFYLIFGVRLSFNRAEYEGNDRFLNACKETAQLLPKDAIVMTPDPWEFSFHANRLSVVLPPTEDEQVICSIAERYKVKYLAILNQNARNSTFKDMQDGVYPSYLEPVYHSESLAIGKFKERK